MTNKEKSIEITNHHFHIYPIPPSWHEQLYRDCVLSVTSMAEWKDGEFHRILKEVLDYFERGVEGGFVSQNSYNDMKYFASKITEKLDKKE